jgi:hypothetical protein
MENKIKFNDTIILNDGRKTTYNTAMINIATGERWFNSMDVAARSFVKFAISDIKEVL